MASQVEPFPPAVDPQLTDSSKLHPPTPQTQPSTTAQAPAPATSSLAPPAATPEQPAPVSTTTTTTSTATTAPASTELPTPAKDVNVNPPDFQGEVATNNDLPTEAVIRKIQDYTVLDRNGKTRPFKSLYSGHNVPRRVLIIFIRHFFCGNCQEYIRSLSPSITPETLLALPVSTFVVVIGCGTHELIDTYIKETGCQFDVYADPTRRLYDKLGMIRTLNMGSRPAYLQNKNVAQTVVSGVMQGLKHLKSGLALKMGDQRQVGGEFLFEPASMSLDSPVTTPQNDLWRNPLDEAPPREEDEANADLMMNGTTTTASSAQNGTGMPGGFHQDESHHSIEEKRVTWCHRMKTTRDHAEIPELMEILGLTSGGQPVVLKEKDEARYGKALRSRKGTGLSLASQMSRMSMEASRPPVETRVTNGAAATSEDSSGTSNVKA